MPKRGHPIGKQRGRAGLVFGSPSGDWVLLRDAKSSRGSRWRALAERGEEEEEEEGRQDGRETRCAGPRRRCASRRRRRDGHVPPRISRSLLPLTALCIVRSRAKRWPCTAVSLSTALLKKKKRNKIVCDFLDRWNIECDILEYIYIYIIFASRIKCVTSDFEKDLYLSLSLYFSVGVHRYYIAGYYSWKEKSSNRCWIF